MKDSINMRLSKLIPQWWMLCLLLGMRSASGCSFTITVSATSPWQSAVGLAPNESVSITASGSWTPDINDPMAGCGPDGLPYDLYNVYNGANWGALVGLLTSDNPNPPDGNGGINPLPTGSAGGTTIGSGPTTIVNTSGQEENLFLAINDNLVAHSLQDNAGSLAVTIDTGGGGAIPIVSWQSPSSGDVECAGDTAALSVIAYNVNEVFFYDGSTLLGAGSLGFDRVTYTFNWGNLQPGAHEVYAVGMFTDCNGIHTVTTAPVSIVVRPSPAGLVSWWQANDNGNDIISGNDGILENWIGFASGEVGDAFNFNGSDNYVLVPPSPSLDVGQGAGFTLEGWINPSTLAAPMPIAEFERILGSYDGDDVGVQWYVNQPSAGGFYINLKDTSGGNHIANFPGSFLKAAQWQHVALTYDKASGKACVYCNGSLVQSQSIGSFTPQTSWNLLIGARTFYGWQSHPSGSFSGQMDELSLYNRALAPGEIASIAQSGSYGKCPPEGVPVDNQIQAAWNGEWNANNVYDSHDGQIVNAATYASGEYGNAFTLDGLNGYVLIPPSPYSDVGDDDNGFTVGGWINPASTDNQSPIVEYENVLGSTDGNDVGLQFWSFPGGSFYVNIKDDTGGNHIFQTDSGLLQPNTWQHVVLVYDEEAGVAQVYVNGTSVSQQSLGSFTPQTTGYLLFGGHTFYGTAQSPSAAFGGQLDELTLFNRALAADEVASIAQSGGGMPPALASDPNLVSWWPAENNAYDVQNNNSGTLVNAAYCGGEVNSGFQFNGNGNYVLINQSPSIGSDAGFTIEGWINPATLGYPMPVVEWERALGSTDGNDVGLHWYINQPGAGDFYVNLKDLSGTDHPLTFSSATGFLTAGDWQHVAFTYDGSSGLATLYVNGAAVGTQTLPPGLYPETSDGDGNPFNLLLGARTFYGSENAPSQSFYGKMDDLAVYSRPLTGSEILGIYSAHGVGKIW